MVKHKLYYYTKKERKVKPFPRFSEIFLPGISVPPVA